MSTTASTAVLSKAKRPVEIDDESNPKRLKSGNGSSFIQGSIEWILIVSTLI